MLQTLINGHQYRTLDPARPRSGLGRAGVAIGTVAGEVIGALAGFAVVYGRFDRKDGPGWAMIFAGDA